MMANFQEDINIDRPERSILTIYVRPEKFSFSIYEPDKAGSYLYRELTEGNQSEAFSTFKDAFFDYAFFSMPFRKVWIMNHTSLFTFIPNSIYKEKYREIYTRFLFPDSEGIALNHSISSAGITVLHQLSDSIYHFMLRSFTKPEFIHYSAPLIACFLNESRKSENRQMIVNLQNKGIDIFCFSGETFLFGNYFSCNGLQDALYYILFTWKQLQLDQRDDCLYVAGNTIFKEELTNKLALYIQQIQNVTIPPKIHLEGIEIGHIPVELLTLSSCEL
jgi:hypothetical protein